MRKKGIIYTQTARSGPFDNRDADGPPAASRIYNRFTVAKVIS